MPLQTDVQQTIFEIFSQILKNPLEKSDKDFFRVICPSHRWWSADNLVLSSPDDMLLPTGFVWEVGTEWRLDTNRAGDDQGKVFYQNVY